MSLRGDAFAWARSFSNWIEALQPVAESEPIKLFILTYTSRQRDRRIGEVFLSRAAVEAACELKEQDPEVDESYFVIRELRFDQGNP